MMSFGFLIKSFFTIADLISLLGEDIDKGHRKRSLYSGRINSISSPLHPSFDEKKEKLLLSALEYKTEKQEDYLKEINRIKAGAFREGCKLFSPTKNSIQYLYIIPQDLHLSEDKTELILKEKALERSVLDWPVIEFAVGSEKANILQTKEKRQGSKLGILNSIFAVLGFSSGISFEYCGKGIEVGSYIFCYGLGKRIVKGGEQIESVNVKYITTSMDLMKHYLKENVIQNVFICAGLLVALSASSYYLWKNYEEGAIRLLEKDEDDNVKKNITQGTTDLVSKHYSLYKREKAIKQIKCKCNENFKNIVNFPCCHVDLCVVCFANKVDRVCEICNSEVNDFHILEL